MSGKRSLAQAIKEDTDVKPYPEPYRGHPVYDTLMWEADQEFTRLVREANLLHNPWAEGRGLGKETPFERAILQAEATFMVRLYKAEAASAAVDLAALP